jgi:hypothetical protein
MEQHNMTIDFLSLDITCMFTTPAILPVFKGSMLRGSFGHSLKKIACSLRQQECESCLLADSCAYAIIFETEKLSGELVAARPHPYILNASADERRAYCVGENIRFNLTLFGRACHFLPHIIYTVEEMGKNGLGRGAGSGDGQFSLRCVEQAEDVLYHNDTCVLNRPRVLPKLKLEDNGTEADALAVDLLSPLRIKSNTGFVRSVDFPLLVRAALRRVSMLERHYGGGEPELDFSGIVRQAEALLWWRVMLPGMSISGIRINRSRVWFLVVW